MNVRERRSAQKAAKMNKKLNLYLKNKKQPLSKKKKVLINLNLSHFSNLNIPINVKKEEKKVSMMIVNK